MKRCLIIITILLSAGFAFAKDDGTEDPSLAKVLFEDRTCQAACEGIQSMEECQLICEEKNAQRWENAKNLEDETWVTENIASFLKSEGFDQEIVNISMPLDLLEKYSPLVTYEVCFKDQSCRLIHFDYSKWTLGE